MPADHGRTRYRASFGSLASGKAPGSDGILPPPPPPPPPPPVPDLIKHCKTTYCILCMYFPVNADKELYHKTCGKPRSSHSSGTRRDCNNYRGVSLLSVIGKVFAKVILIQLQKLAERVYPESQGGFQAGRPTINMVLFLHQLQEKCKEQQMPLYIAFIDKFV